MSTQVFFTSLMVPYMKPRSNIGGLEAHTEPPPAVGLVGDVFLIKNCSGVIFNEKSLHVDFSLGTDH